MSRCKIHDGDGTGTGDGGGDDDDDARQSMRTIAVGKMTLKAAF